MIGPKTYSRRTVLLAGAVGAIGVAVGSKIAGVGPLASSPAGTSSQVGSFLCVSDTYNLDPNYWAYTAALEQKLGRTFAGFRLNGGFTRPGDWPEMHKSLAAGRHWTYLNGKPQNAVTGYWKAVTAGQYDQAFHTFIQTVVADGSWSPARPFRYSFHHEQTVTSEGGGTAAGTAADYAHAWNHVASLIDAAGAHVSQGGPFERCWTPHWLQVSRDPAYRVTTKTASPTVNALLASKILAGGLDTTKLDHIGADIYDDTTAMFTADDQWTPLHKLALQLGKPFFTGETGVAGTDTKVLTWLRRLDTLLKSWGAGTGPGQVEALCWTCRIATRGTQTFDYRPDATPTRLAQYKTMWADPFYGARLL